MQREDTVNATYVESILTATYRDSPFVGEAYSRFEQPSASFPTLENLLAHIAKERAQHRNYFDLVVHYPETKGLLRKKTINLIPEKCGGAKWREKLEGWGLIQLQLTFLDVGLVKCRIAVNTEKRAQAWADTLDELGDPGIWDWKLVEKHARRLIHVLRKGA